MTMLDTIAGAQAVDAHRPWPRAIVTDAGWRQAIDALATGRWTLSGLWGDAGAVHMAVIDEGGDIAMLTAHHYIMGQDNPAATIGFMLAEEKKFQPALAKFQAAAQAARVPWRMCETQSFSGGGKAGVSDTFASALWALDYLFVLAGYGCAGVNMETGVNHLGRVSKYTPITGTPPGPYAPAPDDECRTRTGSRPARVMLHPCGDSRINRERWRPCVIRGAVPAPPARRMRISSSGMCLNRGRSRE